MDPPEVVVIQLLRRRLLEAVDLHPLRVETAHHMLDRPVLSCRIHGLEHQQQGLPVLGVKFILQHGHPLHVAAQLLARVLLVGKSVGIRRVKFADGKAVPFGKTVLLDVHVRPPLSYSWI